MRVAVAGAGIVGLACAAELVSRGHDVRVFDPMPASGATHAAAGMIAPAGEAWHGELPLLRLGLASAQLWPEYAARLGALTGTDVDFRPHGTLMVGQDHDDLQEVRRRLEVLSAEGVEFRELGRRDLREREPGLCRAAGGALLPEDHNVNPRRVAQALLRVVGDRVVRTTVEEVDATGGRVVLGDSTGFACDAVVVATGAAARRWVPQVRPVKGETIRLLVRDGPRHVLRAQVHGEAVYLVPRSDGEIVVGATEEEHDTVATPTLGPVLRLLNAARALVPGLETADILDITARHRPGTPDNGPLLGLAASDSPLRQVLAVGHFRGGVLLAPLTALAVRAYVEGGAVPEAALAFTPDRFEPTSDAHQSTNSRKGTVAS